ncbi:MAG: hypothetical protein QGM45_12140, partial [Anaerolineales bacterium]|nr:hypothetical protein [Anaerolineales bacterium]
YISSIILLFGAEVASEYPRVLRGDYPENDGKPAVPLRQRIVTLLRSLVVSDPKDGTGSRP